MPFANVNFKNSLSPTGYGTQEYSYKTYHEGLRKGDIVVVETAGGLSLARFARYIKESETPNHINLAYIVERVNVEKHERLKALHEDDNYDNLLD